MSTASLNPFRRRRRQQSNPFALRRKRIRRFARVKFGLLMLFVGCLIALHLHRPRLPAPPLVCTAPVIAPLPPVENDVPARPLIDPIPDPWDEKVYRCKEGGHHKEGLPALFSSFRERAPFISVPAPPSAGLLLVGLALIQGMTLWRRRRTTAQGAPRS